VQGLRKKYYLAKDHLLFRNRSRNNHLHIKEAILWIYRAQDATSNGGVSHSYLIGQGWARSYPETTGYIIPSLLNWYRVTEEEEPRKRALKMADWEISIQLENGGIPNLVTGEPVIFDTGQVIFGLMSAFEATNDNRYFEGARKAGEWLIENLDKDFVWRKYGNPGSENVHTYNVRVAWALLELSRISGITKFRTLMEGFIDWALSQEVQNGWFRFNCLNDNDHPLLHTIAYTAQGLLESGLLLENDKCIHAAIRTLDALLSHVSEDGRMPGRFDKGWNSTVRWSCLTGMAQISIIWERLFKTTGEKKYKNASERVNNFLKRTQDISSKNPGIRGGIKGSYPVNGDYGKYRVLNWATKFFIDALMLEEYSNSSLSVY
jgi:uncharacterized protein YyaL (SSP411 family)